MAMPTLYLTKLPKTYDGEKTTSSQQMLLGKIVICLQKTETGSIPISLYKYQLKVILADNKGKGREYSGSSKYRQGLLQ
jgi:hypothetical protein